MARTKYYTLVVKEPQGLWSAQFGDWDRATVRDEERDMRQGGGWIRGTKTKVICTGPRQTDVDAAIAALNAAMG